MFEKVTNFKQNVQEKKGVSPVIGIILMVAITVILSAVIGTFVLGLGNNINENPNAGVQTKLLDNGNKKVTVVSMDNAEYVHVNYPNGSVYDANTSDSIVEGNLTSVGESVNVDGTSSWSVVAHQGTEKAVIQTIEAE